MPIIPINKYSLPYYNGQLFFSDYLSKSGNLSGVASPFTSQQNIGVYTGLSLLDTSADFATTYWVQKLFSISGGGGGGATGVNWGAIGGLINNQTDLYSILVSISGQSSTGFYLLATNNLSDLTNATSGRLNLGLGTISILNSGQFIQTGASGAFLQSNNNLSDISNVASGRLNLGLGTASTQPTSFFLQTNNNLSDINNSTSGRLNLGLGTAATLNSGQFLLTGSSGSFILMANSGVFLQVNNNLSDLGSTSIARGNLGLGNSAVLNTGTSLIDSSSSIATDYFVQQVINNSGVLYMSTGVSGNFVQNSTTGQFIQTGVSGSLLKTFNNLSDVSSIPTSRSNLGLGNAAVLNTGTSLTDSSSNVATDYFVQQNINNSGILYIGTGISGSFLKTFNNLSDVNNPSSGRLNLGIGTVGTGNFDGNSSHYLQGNGVWGTVAGGGGWVVNGSDTYYTAGNVIAGNSLFVGNYPSNNFATYTYNSISFYGYAYLQSYGGTQILDFQGNGRTKLVVAYEQTRFFDDNGIILVDMNANHLYDATFNGYNFPGNLSVDWNNRILAGNWTGNGTFASASGIPIDFGSYNGVTSWEVNVGGTPINVTCAAVSDKNLKTNIKPHKTGVLNKLSLLDKTENGFCEFNFNDKHLSKHPNLTGIYNGFLAQEMETIFPEAVTTNPKNGQKGISYDILIPTLIQSIIELKKEVETLKK